ncbi:hypothetical protein ACHAXA_008222 [Cyclostephanos tholiformis]|uniref:Uncharacterized protein n=1 Tax=Cyclostephanos tholiformis TaxID=382380 RepID=A0ABD3R119_9STRA
MVMRRHDVVIRLLLSLSFALACAASSSPAAVVFTGGASSSPRSASSSTSFVVGLGGRWRCVDDDVVVGRRGAWGKGSSRFVGPISLATNAGTWGRRRRYDVYDGDAVVRSYETTCRADANDDDDAADAIFAMKSSTPSFLEETQTLLRVLLPASASGILATYLFPTLCRHITKFVIETTSGQHVSMLGDATSSFVGLVGLLYSILMGQVFGFLYGQQEALYYALYDEVTEAKSLLEQVALVSQGRTMYVTCLDSIARYVRDDLLRGTMLSTSESRSSTNGATTTAMGGGRRSRSSRWWRGRIWRRRRHVDNAKTVITPSSLLSARPADDPLEAILYLTSVGTPGMIYDTVRSLRQARSRRLGALQRKVPMMHLAILWILGGVMISSFPILVGVGGASVIASSASAGSASSMRAAAGAVSYGGIITLQGMFFGMATFAVVMTKLVLGELWRTKAHSGAYNVDAALRVMVRGLQNELEERTNEATGAMERRRIDDYQ